MRCGGRHLRDGVVCLRACVHACYGIESAGYWAALLEISGIVTTVCFRLDWRADLCITIQ